MWVRRGRGTGRRIPWRCPTLKCSEIGKSHCDHWVAVVPKTSGAGLGALGLSLSDGFLTPQLTLVCHGSAYRSGRSMWPIPKDGKLS